MTQLVAKDGKVGENVKFERIRRITGYLVGTLARLHLLGFPPYSVVLISDASL